MPRPPAYFAHYWILMLLPSGVDAAPPCVCANYAPDSSAKLSVDAAPPRVCADGCWLLNMINVVTIIRRRLWRRQRYDVSNNIEPGSDGDDADVDVDVVANVDADAELNYWHWWWFIDMDNINREVREGNTKYEIWREIWRQIWRQKPPATWSFWGEVSCHICLHISLAIFSVILRVIFENMEPNMERIWSKKLLRIGLNRKEKKKKWGPQRGCKEWCMALFGG